MYPILELALSSYSRLGKRKNVRQKKQAENYQQV